MPRPITRLEVEAALRRDVKHYMSLGASKTNAMKQVSIEHGLDPEWVAQLVDGEPGSEA